VLPRHVVDRPGGWLHPRDIKLQYLAATLHPLLGHHVVAWSVQIVHGCMEHATSPCSSCMTSGHQTRAEWVIKARKRLAAVVWRMANHADTHACHRVRNSVQVSRSHAADECTKGGRTDRSLHFVALLMLVSSEADPCCAFYSVHSCVHLMKHYEWLACNPAPMHARSQQCVVSSGSN
jgi:hypothetical protein